MTDLWYEKIIKEGCPKCGDKDHLSLLSDETRRYPLRWDAGHQEIEYGPSEPWAEGDYDRILCGQCQAVIEE